MNKIYKLIYGFSPIKEGLISLECYVLSISKRRILLIDGNDTLNCSSLISSKSLNSLRKAKRNNKECFINGHTYFEKIKNKKVYGVRFFINEVFVYDKANKERPLQEILPTALCNVLNQNFSKKVDRFYNGN